MENTVNLSFAEVAAALGPDAIVLRLVALQREVTSLKARVAELEAAEVH